MLNSREVLLLHKRIKSENQLLMERDFEIVSPRHMFLKPTNYVLETNKIYNNRYRNRGVTTR